MNGSDGARAHGASGLGRDFFGERVRPRKVSTVCLPPPERSEVRGAYCRNRESRILKPASTSMRPFWRQWPALHGDP